MHSRICCRAAGGCRREEAGRAAESAGRRRWPLNQEAGLHAVDPDAVAEAEEKAKAAKDAEGKRIEEDNKRKQDEYDKKVEAGEKRVQELNDRFADWYFVISDSTYQKIHISRDQLVKKKTVAAGEGNGPADLDALKNDALKNFRCRRSDADSRRSGRRQ